MTISHVCFITSADAFIKQLSSHGSPSSYLSHHNIDEENEPNDESIVSDI
jgi:hypothetical protein